MAGNLSFVPRLVRAILVTGEGFFLYFIFILFYFIYLFIKQKYVTILTIVHLDKCSCIGLEPSAIANFFRRIFPTSLPGDVTSEIAEDDWVRGCRNLSLQGPLAGAQEYMV